MSKRITKKDREKVTQFIGNHAWHIMNCAKMPLDFEINYKSSKYATECEQKPFKGKSGASMTIEVDYKYLTADLIYDDKTIMNAYKDKNYYYIIQLLCHEIAHIISGEGFEKLKIKYTGESAFQQERLTERIGRLIYDVYYDTMKRRKINLKNGKAKK